MANDEKQQKNKGPATELTPRADVGTAQGGVDLSDRIGRLESRVIVVETENGDLKRLLSEQGAEVKELRLDLKELGDEASGLRMELSELGAALASGAIVSPHAMVASVRRDKKGEIPAGFFRNSRGLLVADEYKGEKKYELSETGFINGALKQAGERITVHDEQPSKTWLPLVPKVTEELVAGPAPTTIRTADREA